MPRTVVGVDPSLHVGLKGVSPDPWPGGLNGVDVGVQLGLKLIELGMQAPDSGLEVLHDHQLIDGLPHDLHDGVAFVGDNDIRVVDRDK